MKSKLFISVISIFFLIISTHAQSVSPSTIVCTLRNGDRVSGHAPTFAAGVLSFETEYMGRATLRSSALAACETEDPALRAKVNELISIASVTPENPATVEVAKSTLSTPTVAPKKPEPEDSWKKTIAFSYAFARGNADVNDMNLSGSVVHKERDGRFVLQAFLRRGTKNGQDFADLFTTNARYERKLESEFLEIDNVSFFNEVAYEQDALKKLDHRLSWNGGMQFPLVKNESAEMALDVGGGVTREDYSTDVHRTLGSGLLRFKSEQTILGRTKLSQQIAAFPDFAEVGRYRLHADLSVTAPITRIFSVRVGALNRFDNRPQEAVKRNDFSLLSGLALNF